MVKVKAHYRKKSTQIPERREVHRIVNACPIICRSDRFRDAILKFARETFWSRPSTKLSFSGRSAGERYFSLANKSADQKPSSDSLLPRRAFVESCSARNFARNASQSRKLRSFGAPENPLRQRSTLTTLLDATPWRKSRPPRAAMSDIKIRKCTC